LGKLGREREREEAIISLLALQRIPREVGNLKKNSTQKLTAGDIFLHFVFNIDKWILSPAKKEINDAPHRPRLAPPEALNGNLLQHP